VYTDDSLDPSLNRILAFSAQSLLKQDYKDEITLEEAKALALKIMSKTMDSTKLGSEKRRSPVCNFRVSSGVFPDPLSITVEFATMTLDPATQLPLAKIFRSAELDELLRKYELGGTSDSEVGVGQGTGGGSGGDTSISVST